MVQLSQAMTNKIDLIPDIFDPTLIHVINESEEAGTMKAKEGHFEAVQLNGNRWVCLDRKKAIQFLLTGKMRPEPRQAAPNQLSLF